MIDVVQFYSSAYKEVHTIDKCLSADGEKDSVNSAGNSGFGPLPSAAVIFKNNLHDRPGWGC